MRVRATPAALFAAFVVVAVVAGLCLAALEGTDSRHPVLEILLTVSFFSVLPLLIIATVFAWREMPESARQHPESVPRRSVVTPISMFLFGVFALIVSNAFEHVAHARPLSVFGSMVAVLEAAAIPSLVASFVWKLTIWKKQRGR
jgi:cytochrome bd-type quinol oxidase subunit 2